jgi:hypothetical protein
MPLIRGDWDAAIDDVLEGLSTIVKPYRNVAYRALAERILASASVAPSHSPLRCSFALSIDPKNMKPDRQNGPLRQAAVLWWRRPSPGVGTRTSSRRHTEADSQAVGYGTARS